MLVAMLRYCSNKYKEALPTASRIPSEGCIRILLQERVMLAQANAKNSTIHVRIADDLDFKRF